MACVIAIAIAAPAALAAQPTATRTDRGIVQSVSARGLLLKVLDGTTLAVPIDSRTRVFLNGKPASILDLEPGFVAVVVYEAAKRDGKATAAHVVQAFSAPSRPTTFDGGRGTVQSVSAGELVVRAPSGGRLQIRIDQKTRVLLNGRRASILDVEPGFAAVVTYAHRPPKAAKTVGPRKRALGGSVAQVLWAFAPESGAAARPDQGIVQSLAPDAIVLDGSGGKLVIEIDATTRVFVNGKARTLREVEPGFVAVVRRGPGGPAREVWAFGRAVR